MIQRTYPVSSSKKGGILQNIVNGVGNNCMKFNCKILMRGREISTEMKFK